MESAGCHIPSPAKAWPAPGISAAQPRGQSRSAATQPGRAADPQPARISPRFPPVISWAQPSSVLLACPGFYAIFPHEIRVLHNLMVACPGAGWRTRANPRAHRVFRPVPGGLPAQGPRQNGRFRWMNHQLHIGFETRPGRRTARCIRKRSHRAQWWFERMREIVAEARDWPPAAPPSAADEASVASMASGEPSDHT